LFKKLFQIRLVTIPTKRLGWAKQMSATILCHLQGIAAIIGLNPTSIDSPAYTGGVVAMV